MLQAYIEKITQRAIKHHRAGQLPQAAGLYEQVLVLNPNHPDVLNLLGVISRQNGQLQRAVELGERAVAVVPDWAEGYTNLGNALRANGQFRDAIAAYRRAIEIKPDLPEPHGNLGIALQDDGQLDDALAAYHRAIALRPVYADAHYNMGVTLRAQGQWDQARAAFRRAISINHQFPEAHYSLALLLLSRGNFADGWREHEWRWKWNAFPSERRPFAQPLWKGKDLTGHTILLHDEQGFGDTIQFVRYVPMVAARGGKVILLCPPHLRRLLAGLSGVDHWLESGQPFPHFDVHCPLLSLPLRFGTTIETIPRFVPYISANADEVERWRQRLPGNRKQLRVGLVWAGSPVHKNDRNRSMSLETLSPLAQVPDVEFYSLQQGDAGAFRGLGIPPMHLPLERPPHGQDAHATENDNHYQMHDGLIDLTEHITDFAATAGLIAHLDLVISVDTAVAHLTGAMGKPVWILLAAVPDWRWLLDRNDSPWYPSARLFRQTTAGDWDGVVRRLVDSLRELQPDFDHGLHPEHR